MMPRDHAARLVSNERIADDIADLRFELAGQTDGLTPKPGQFAYLAAPGVFLRRPISIAGFDPDGNVVRFIVRLVGEGTRNIAMQKPGETIKILMPLGNPFPMVSSGNIWLVGGGLGVAPLLYLARALSGTASGLRSFLGFSDERSVFGAEEMREFSEMTLDVGGFITDRVSDALASKPPDAVFSCGPKPMMGALKKICDARDVPLYVSLEERMGCGVGACLVCACAVRGAAGYKRVCKDGPVFDAREVVFP
jgi:dihydroorotate dehydrogenase electron transfer subunit